MKRPCECGCKAESHFDISILDKSWQGLYCQECPKNSSGLWCYKYRPIGNLEWLEYLYEQSIKS